MSPGRMIVALYDRLAVDLDRAQQAIADADPSTAHECLVHAQAIVSELHDSLDVEQWPAAREPEGHLRVPALRARRAPTSTRTRRRSRRAATLVVPLRDAWREAAGIVPSPAGGPA